MPYGASPTTQSIISETVKPRPCRRLGCSFTLFRAGTLQDEHGEVFFSLIDPDVVALTHRSGDQMDTCPVPIAWIEDLNTKIIASLKPWFASLHDPEKRLSFKPDQLRRRTFRRKRPAPASEMRGEG